MVYTALLTAARGGEGLQGCHSRWFGTGEQGSDNFGSAVPGMGSPNGLGQAAEASDQPFPVAWDTGATVALGCCDPRCLEAAVQAGCGDQKIKDRVERGSLGADMLWRPSSRQLWGVHEIESQFIPQGCNALAACTWKLLCDSALQRLPGLGRGGGRLLGGLAFQAAGATQLGGSARTWQVLLRVKEYMS